MYVVVRIWDLRRLVLPLSYFLDHPFQNWTRTGAQLLANALLYVDYTIPMEELRTELRRICEASPLWKGEVCVLQASDVTEHTVQLRALMDARNSSDAWDLRCLVREKLVEYLQNNHPKSLPRYRGEVQGDSGHANQQSESGLYPEARRPKDSLPSRPAAMCDGVLKSLSYLSPPPCPRTKARPSEQHRENRQTLTASS